MSNLYENYTISLDSDTEYKVKNKHNKKVVFYGTRTECREWLERNGHDTSIE